MIQTKRTKTSTPKAWTGLLLMLLAMACGWFASPVKAQALEFPESAPTEQMLADQLMAMAWMSFGGVADARPDQLQRGRILLDMATELAPDDVGIWELRASLAKGMQDTDMLIDSLKQYTRLVPDDDVAQFELVQARLSKIESIDSYLDAVERLLNAEGVSSFSAPLRSRLASLAAQAAQEVGDNERSAEWLVYALKLDPVNPIAAHMMYQLTLDRNGSSRQQGAALVYLLGASPVDPSVRVALAHLLMQEAVYDRALDQYDFSMGLVDMQTRLELLTQYTLCLIASGREDEVPPLLLELQMFMKQLADAQNPDQTLDENMEPEPPSLEDLPPLPTTLEFARLILMYKDNPVAAEESFNRLQESSAAVEDPEQRGELLRQLVWIGAVFDQDAAWVQQRISALGPDDTYSKLASGWLALRNGDAQAARSIFESLGPDEMFARLGLASLPDLSDDEKAQAYQQMIWDAPTSMGAIVAARRLHQMDKPITPTGEGVSLRVLVDGVSRQLWTPALTVSPWIRTRLTVSPGSFGYLQPMRATVTMLNATRLPLSIGQGGAVNAPLMVMCMPSIRNEPKGRTSPTFFNMGRRLTLQPGHAITVDIRLDRFDMGQLTAMYPTEPITFSAIAMLDPRPTPNGGILPGPLGSTVNASSLLARAMPATPSNLQLWMKDVDGTDPAVRALAIARLLVIANQPTESTEAADFRAKVRDMIAQRYPSFDSKLKAWTVRFMLPDENGEPVSQRVIDLASRSDDPMVRIIYLVMNARGADSPALTDAIRHDNPTIRTFAQAMKTGFEEDAKLAGEAEGQMGENAPVPALDPLAPVETAPSQDLPWLP